MTGAGSSFIGRKSFALIENSHILGSRVENNSSIHQGRNPWINVDKCKTWSYTVEICAKWLGLLQVVAL
jgi:hypothetical protein